MLIKSGLVGVQNGCIVTRGDLETIRLQLEGVLKMAGGVLGSGTVQRKFRFVQRHVLDQILSGRPTPILYA